MPQPTGVGATRLLLCRLSKPAQQQHELPALFVGVAFFEAGHGAVTLSDLVEEFAVGHGVHVRGVGEIGWRGIIHFGLPTIALAGLAVALRTLVVVKPSRTGQISL